MFVQTAQCSPHGRELGRAVAGFSGDLRVQCPRVQGTNGRTLQGSTPHTAWPGVAAAIFGTVPRLGSTDFVTAAWAVLRGPRQSISLAPNFELTCQSAIHCRASPHTAGPGVTAHFSAPRHG